MSSWAKSFYPVILIVFTSCSTHTQDLTLQPSCEQTASCTYSKANNYYDVNAVSTPWHADSKGEATLSFQCKSSHYKFACATQWITVTNSRGKVLWKERGPVLRIPIQKTTDLRVSLSKKEKPISLSKVKPGEIRAVSI